MTLLAQLVAALAVGLLKALLARRDLMSAGQAVEFEEALKHANTALVWKADAATRPDGGATVGVRPDAPPITLPGHHPDSTIPTSGTAVPGSRTDDVHSS